MTALFFLAGICNLIAQVIDSQELNMYTKPLLMPLLVYLVYLMASGTITLPRLLLAGALIFSWAGDLLLLYQEDQLFFLLGLGCFLIAQVLYVVILNRAVYQPVKVRIGRLIPVLVYGVLLLGVLLPKAGPLAVPILFYALCILGMVSSARLRQGLTSEASFRWALAGAILFVISDGILAINRFVIDLPVASFYVMATYILAQYFLVRGILLHQG